MTLSAHPNPASSEAAPSDETEHTEAQRPHLLSRWRLVPLGGLALLVASAAIVGVAHGGPVSADVQQHTPKGPMDAVHHNIVKSAKRQSICTPSYNPANHGEPWQGKQRASSEATFQHSITKKSKYYVKGNNGVYFFGDNVDSNFSQSLGRVTQSAKLEKTWASYLAAAQRSVAASGGEFHVVIAPANWDIYHQDLPSWSQKLRGTTSLERLVKDHPELPWIDVRAPLAKAAKKHPTYEPVNSHWTPYGGWVAWQAITKCLRTNPAFAALREPAITGVGTAANLNEFTSYGIPDGKPQHTYPIFAVPHPATSTTHIPDGAPVPTYPDGSLDETYLPAMTTTPGAMSPLKLLVFRDSTGDALSPLWDWTFGTTISYVHGVGQNQPGPDIAALAQTYHPNVVLFVMTERFLVHPPAH